MTARRWQALAFSKMGASDLRTPSSFGSSPAAAACASAARGARIEAAVTMTARTCFLQLMGTVPISWWQRWVDGSVESRVGCGASDAPRLAHGAGPHAVRLDIAQELVLRRIEAERPAELPGDVGGMAGDVRLPRDGRVGPRLRPRLDAVEE